MLHALAWSPQQPTRRAVERDEAAITLWVKARWPVVKQDAARRHAALIFIDEAGILMTPLVRRTLAPCGQTPVLYQRGRSRQKVSVIAALVIPTRRDRVRCLFRLAPDSSIDAVGVRAFLGYLARLIRSPATIIWDRSNTHRGTVVRRWLAAHPRVRVELLPPYAPELNPVELV